MRLQMEEEQWDLCRLLDAALHSRPAEMLPPAEKYGAFLELADRHRVLPLLYDVLAPKLPEEDENRKRLEKKSAETVRQSYRLLFLGKYVTGLLQEHGIETVLLKGSGTAGLYPVPELRKSGDIDLLVADQKAGEKAYEVLHEHGFRKALEQHAHHHIVCVGTEQIGIEIHVALAEPFDSKSVNEWLAAHQAEFLAHCERTAVMGVEFPGAAAGISCVLPAASYAAAFPACRIRVKAALRLGRILGKGIRQRGRGAFLLHGRGMPRDGICAAGDGGLCKISGTFRGKSAPAAVQI